MRTLTIIGCAAVSFLALGNSSVLAAAGDFDASFNRVGFTREHVGDWSSSYGLGIHSSGEIVTAGVYGNPITQTVDLVLWRHLADGTPDTTFGGTGVIYPPTSGIFPGSANSLTVDHQNRIVLLTASPRDYFLYRFNFDGSPDLSFSGSGRVTIPIGAPIYALTEVMTQADDRIVGVGAATNPATGRWEFFVFRLLESGELDPSFAGTGRVWTPITPGGGNDRSTGVAIQRDGKIVVAGRAKTLDPASNYDFALARYTPSGELDESFGTGGKVVFPVLDDNLGRKVVIQPDGKIVITGYTCEEIIGGDEYCYFGIARVDQCGVLDPTFGGTGKVHTEVGNGFPYDLALQSDNKIVAVGIHLVVADFSASNVVLARYQPDGLLDTAFGLNGISETNYGYIVNSAGNVRIQSDGQIVVAGGTRGTGTSAVIARYQAGGGEPSGVLRDSRNQPFGLAP
jgi:uncharacterized delta-60 repeat protein